MNELGIDKNSMMCLGNQTYTPVLINEKGIVEEHCKLLWEKFKLHVNEENQKLPRIFWNPKLHKTPFKAPFIAGATNCSTKKLSKLVNKALQVVLIGFRKYCKAIYRRTGINCDWGINSTSQFLDKLNNETEIYNAQVYDFSTLYTNLELDEVKTAMKGMLDLTFNSDKNKFINISLRKNEQFFSNKRYNDHYIFDKILLLEATNFILDNAYVTFGNFVLKQNWGITMGGNCSTELSNCTLGWFEYVYMKSLINRKNHAGWPLAKLLSGNSRFVDDLITLNYKNFGNLYQKIYPSCLQMERCGNENQNVNYLDVKFIMDGKGHYTTNIYNKLDDFDFPVVQYTFPSSNMPHEVGHNVFFMAKYSGTLFCAHKSVRLLQRYGNFIKR